MPVLNGSIAILTRAGQSVRKHHKSEVNRAKTRNNKGTDGSVFRLRGQCETQKGKAKKGKRKPAGGGS